MVQPARIFGILALDHLEEFLLEVLGHRTGVARADQAVVQFADGREFRRRAR